MVPRTITRNVFNGFLFYLLSHNRPIAEVINPTLLDISEIYEKDFVGMTNDSVSLKDLLDARTHLIRMLHQSAVSILYLLDSMFMDGLSGPLKKN